MTLSARLLKNVSGVNNWQYATNWTFAEGQPKDLYFQVVDIEVETAINPKQSAFVEQPIRYISSATVLSASAIFDSIDDADILTVGATNPFPGDLSIFRISLSSSQLPGSGNVKFTIMEDGVSRTFIVKNAITVDMLNVGGC